MEFLAAWIAWQALHPFLTLLIYQLTGILGMVVHFLKRKVKGQELKDIKAYFKENPKETIITVITVLVGVFGCLIIGEGIVAAFGVGYLGDSALNKGSE